MVSYTTLLCLYYLLLCYCPHCDTMQNTKVLRKKDPKKDKTSVCATFKRYTVSFFFCRTFVYGTRTGYRAVRGAFSSMFGHTSANPSLFMRVALSLAPNACKRIIQHQGSSSSVSWRARLFRLTCTLIQRLVPLVNCKNCPASKRSPT